MGLGGNLQLEAHMRSAPASVSGTDGEAIQAEALFPAIYEDLRKVAAHRLAALAPGQTLQATALVHEAWLRLAQGQPRTWKNRVHFFAAAAEVMRHVLIDHLRSKARLKRGGGQLRLDIDDLDLAATTGNEKILLIEEALEEFEREQPEKARVVVLKFFGGLTDREAAEQLAVTERTIERHWAFAKAWLMRKIREQL